MSLGDLAELAIKKALASGASEAEAYVRKVSITSVRSVGTRIESVSSGSRIELGLRVAVGKRVAIYGAVVYDPGDVEEAARYAVKMARAAPEDPKWSSLPRRLGAAAVEGIYDPRIAEPELEGFVSELRSALEAVPEAEPRSRPTQGSATFTAVERVVANSYGESVSSRSTLFVLFAGAQARGDGEEAGYYDVIARRSLREVDLRGFMEEVGRRAALFLGARRIGSGSYDVVLRGRVFASILNTLIAPAVSAEWVQRGRSPLAGRLGQQVLGSSITIRDDGTAPGLVGTEPFDDEGVATSSKPLFDKGVLRTFVYDSYTAAVEGRRSTGNARRRSVSSAPTPWVTNMVVEPGDASYEELLSSVRRGVVVFSTIGEWLSNPVTGMLNATVSNGLYVENGEVRHAVRSVVLAGNIYELLSRGVEALSREVENSMNVYAPHVLLRGVVIAGEKAPQRA